MRLVLREGANRVRGEETVHGGGSRERKDGAETFRCWYLRQRARLRGRHVKRLPKEDLMRLPILAGGQALSLLSRPGSRPSTGPVPRLNTGRRAHHSIPRQEDLIPELARARDIADDGESEEAENGYFDDDEHG